MHIHTHVCRVIVIVSHRSDPLPEAGLCQHDLDLSPMLPTMNDWPCSYSVALRPLPQHVPYRFCTLDFTLPCKTCYAQHFSSSLCNSPRFITVFVASAAAAVGAS